MVGIIAKISRAELCINDIKIEFSGAVDGVKGKRNLHSTGDSN